MPRPNLLLITTDQQSANMLSCAGNPDVQTPHLDALAADGVWFECAYLAQPLCIPQRCSWYSGLMPHEHGLTFNLPGKEVDAPTMMGRIFRYNNPHNICEAARGGPFPDGEPGLPENLGQLLPLPENFAIPEHEPTILREVQKMYSSKNYPVHNWDETRWKLHRWFYNRMVEMVDAHIGNLLAVLDKHNLADDTLIVFASDHGDGNAHHQWNQKQSLYDESARVPFFVCKPGSGLQQVHTAGLVNTGIDLIPTLCGLAGIPVPDHLNGTDWSEVLNGTSPSDPPDHLVVETEFGTYGQPAGIMGRAVRTARFKYSVYNQGDCREILADMEQDAGETRNLVGHPECLSELERHRRLLRDYIETSGDVFPLEKVGA